VEEKLIQLSNLDGTLPGVTINNSIQGNSVIDSVGSPDRSTTIDTLAIKTDVK
jgi:hypothetical protein